MVTITNSSKCSISQFLENPESWIKNHNCIVLSHSEVQYGWAKNKIGELYSPFCKTNPTTDNCLTITATKDEITDELIKDINGLLSPAWKLCDC